MRWKARDPDKHDKWRLWFAWRPVQINDDCASFDEWVWLEHVLRRQDTSSSGQEYWMYRG